MTHDPTPDFHARRRRGFTAAWRTLVTTPLRQVVLQEHPAVRKFFADRCTHLAGMIAYFGLLSIIPAAFLFVSVLAWSGHLSSQGWVVHQLSFIMPGPGVHDIVRTVDSLRSNSGSVGLIGVVGLIWGSLAFFSVIESALNIVYGVENRKFLHQKVWVLFLVAASVVVMVVSVVIATFTLPYLERTNKLISESFFAKYTSFDTIVSTFVSLIVVFAFLCMMYRLLPNVHVHTSEVWRGALVGALAFEVSVQLLPLLLQAAEYTVVLRAFTGGVIVLVWFYFMSLMLLVGAELNWWLAYKRALDHIKDDATVTSQAG
jgi:membrane protein